MQPDNLANVFLVLKQILKRRGQTYKTLGDALGISEGAVKNMFARGICQLDRLMEICAFLGVSLGELFSSAEAHSSEVLVLSEEQEQAFADNPDLFRFFQACFYDEMTPREVKRKWKLSDQTLARWLRSLEQIGIAERLPEYKLQFLVRGKLQWRPRGPWMRAYLKKINALAAERVLNERSSWYALGYATLSADQLAGFRAELDSVIKKYRDIAARDWLVRDRLEQHPVSWTFSLVPGDVCIEASGR